MAALFDTTVGVLLLRRNPPRETAGLLRAARAEILAGSALLPAPAVSELLLGERTPKGVARLGDILSGLPTVILSAEAAGYAGSMGAFLAARGASLPFPDLLIAGTAVCLEIPLLTWDSDYSGASRVATSSHTTHPGATLLRKLELHPASRAA